MKLTSRVADCCASMIVGEYDNQEYFKILSRWWVEYRTRSNPLNNNIMSLAASQFLMNHIQLSKEMGFLQKPRHNVFSTGVNFH